MDVLYLLVWCAVLAVLAALVRVLVIRGPPRVMEASRCGINTEPN